MRLVSPPHIAVDSDFADVKGESTLPMAQWIHVAHTYQRGNSRIYVNGRLDGATTPVLDIKIPAKMWIGGWYDHFSFVGDIDEVRISRVARSPDWIRLEYENQKPMQTLVGGLVPPGSDFSVSPPQLSVPEGRSATFTARAGGAGRFTGCSGAIEGRRSSRWTGCLTRWTPAAWSVTNRSPSSSGPSIPTRSGPRTSPSRSGKRSRNRFSP